MTHISMTQLEDLCCAEVRVLLSPNQKLGAELVRLGLLELHLSSYLTISCTPISTTIEVPNLETIKQHQAYKSFHPFLNDALAGAKSTPLETLMSEAKKYFGLNLEAFNTYAITPALVSRKLLIKKSHKRFFLFNKTKLKLTKDGENLKQNLLAQLEQAEITAQKHALLKPDVPSNLSDEERTTINCFTKAFSKALKTSKVSTITPI